MHSWLFLNKCKTTKFFWNSICHPKLFPVPVEFQMNHQWSKLLILGSPSLCKLHRQHSHQSHHRILSLHKKEVNLSLHFQSFCRCCLLFQNSSVPLKMEFKLISATIISSDLCYHYIKYFGRCKTRRESVLGSNS